MTNLLQFTINVRKSQRQPQCTLQLVCENRVLFIWAVFAFLYAGSSIQRATAIRLVYPPSFRKHRSSLKSTNKNLTEWGVEILVANEWTYRGRCTDQGKFHFCVINLSLKYWIKVRINRTVSDSFVFVTIHSYAVFVDSNSSNAVTIQN
jgi:hypothetical protein